MAQSYRERHRGQRAIGPQLKAGHMGAPLLYGVRFEESPLTAGSFHIWGARYPKLG